jgi:site-specific DNA-methyltransferase (adenine-specific)
MPQPAPKTASRNRTLRLAATERVALARGLQVLKAPAGTEDVQNRIFNQPLQQAIPYLPTAFADLLFLDPPYNLNRTFGAQAFARRGLEEYAQWFEGWLVQLLPLLKPTASVYVCSDWLTSTSIHMVLSKHLHVHNRITWEREKGRGAKANWKNSHEDIWFATVHRKDFYFDVAAVKLRRKVIAPYKVAGKPKDWEQTERGNFRLTHPGNLWNDISIPFWSMPENTDHPTQKPEKLVAKLLLASTRPADVVLDPFLGSGTTAVVAHKLGRRYVGIEQEKEFCLWALKRLKLAQTEPRIQGYADGVFWERNSGLHTNK